MWVGLIYLRGREGELCVGLFKNIVKGQFTYKLYRDKKSVKFAYKGPTLLANDTIVIFRWTI